MQDILEKIDDYIARGVFPGCEFVIIDGDASRSFCCGEASILPQREILEAGRHWDMASVSKVLGVGTVLINRVLAGKINLDSPLQAYYPAWHDKKRPTVRELLTHTSGLDPYIENRNALDFAGLVSAMNQLKLTSDRHFHYSDVNFILLGFMLEAIDAKSLDEILKAEVFEPWQLTDTDFGPVADAVPTAADVPAGTVHDPKARVLGRHCGSAGLFSTLSDLTAFVKGYFNDEKYLQLLQDWTDNGEDRSLAWALHHYQGQDWLLHTGYTGTFILMNLRLKKAVIFLSNRVHLKDNRAQWIIERDILIDKFIEIV